MNKLQLRHYGASPVTLDRTRRYKNWRHDKPAGLWVSVLGGSPDWAQYCRHEEFDVEHLTVEHEVVLAPDAKILHLTTAEAVAKLQLDYPLSDDDILLDYGVDWDRVCRDYQGIIITPYQWSCRFSVHWYYGWDCASGCIWDMSAIQSLTPVLQRREVAA